MAESPKKRPTALKREIQNKAIHQRHRAFKSRVRTAMRHLDAGLSAKDAAKTKESLDLVFSLMDKGAKKGVFKKNKSDRVKSRLSVRCAAVLAK